MDTPDLSASERATMDLQSGEPVVDPLSPLRNSYAARNNVVQGLLVFALLVANANQIKSLKVFSPQPHIYFFLLGLIVASLVLQVGVAISLIFEGQCDLSKAAKLERANKINNYVLVGVFLIIGISGVITYNIPDLSVIEPR